MDLRSCDVQGFVFSILLKKTNTSRPIQQSNTDLRQKILNVFNDIAVSKGQNLFPNTFLQFLACSCIPSTNRLHTIFRHETEPSTPEPEVKKFFQEQPEIIFQTIFDKFGDLEESAKKGLLKQKFERFDTNGMQQNVTKKGKGVKDCTTVLEHLKKILVYQAQMISTKWKSDKIGTQVGFSLPFLLHLQQTNKVS